MMTELMLVEGVSDVLLISYYLQNVYGWKYQNTNILGIAPLDKHEHVESLSKNENQLILCGVGGNGKFGHFIERHHVNDMLILQDISSLMVVTDRDKESVPRIGRRIDSFFENISFRASQWIQNRVEDSFGQPKSINTYLLIIPENEKGALERVVINALKDMQEEADLIKEVIQFIESLKVELVPELIQMNKADKATVVTFFSVRDPQHAMRSFGSFISKIDWSKSESLQELFRPFMYLGEEKPTEIERTE